MLVEGSRCCMSYFWKGSRPDFTLVIATRQMREFPHHVNHRLIRAQAVHLRIFAPSVKFTRHTTPLASTNNTLLQKNTHSNKGTITPAAFNHAAQFLPTTNNTVHHGWTRKHPQGAAAFNCRIRKCAHLACVRNDLTDIIAGDLERRQEKSLPGQ